MGLGKAALAGKPELKTVGRAEADQCTYWCRRPPGKAHVFFSGGDKFGKLWEREHLSGFLNTSGSARTVAVRLETKAELS